MTAAAAPALKPPEFPGVNAMAICDCKATTFRVGIEVDARGNNHIRCIECTACGHNLAVPFFHDDRALGAAPAGEDVWDEAVMIANKVIESFRVAGQQTGAAEMVRNRLMDAKDARAALGGRRG